jgi:hypothetical protein
MPSIQNQKTKNKPACCRSGSPHPRHQNRIRSHRRCCPILDWQVVLVAGLEVLLLAPWRVVLVFVVYP